MSIGRPEPILEAPALSLAAEVRPLKRHMPAAFRVWHDRAQGRRLTEALGVLRWLKGQGLGG